MSNRKNIRENEYKETCRVWKNKMLEKIKKSQNSVNLVTNLSKKYWKAKTSVLSHNKKQRAKFFPLENEFGVGKSQSVIFFKNSCTKIRDNMNLKYRKVKELSDSEMELADFLRHNTMNESTHSYVMMVQMSSTLTHSLASRILMLPLLERIVGCLNQFIKHGISDAYKSCKEAERESIELQAGLYWMNDLSKEIDPDSPEKLRRFKEVQKYVKESRIKLQEMTNITYDKYTLLVTSRDLIFIKEFKLYFSLLINHFEKSREEFEKYIKEFSGLPHFKYSVLEPVLGPNNGVNSLVIDKYVKSPTYNDEKYSDLVEKLSLIESETDLIDLNFNNEQDVKKILKTDKKPQPLVDIVNEIFNEDSHSNLESLFQIESDTKFITVLENKYDEFFKEEKNEELIIDENLLIFPEQKEKQEIELSQKDIKRLETLKDILEEIDFKEPPKNSQILSHDC